MTLTEKIKVYQARKIVSDLEHKAVVDAEDDIRTSITASNGKSLMEVRVGNNEIVIHLVHRGSSVTLPLEDFTELADKLHDIL